MNYPLMWKDLSEICSIHIEEMPDDFPEMLDCVVRPYLLHVSDRDWDIFNWRYTFRERTDMEIIGKKYMITSTRVRQIINITLQKIGEVIWVFLADWKALWLKSSKVNLPLDTFVLELVKSYAGRRGSLLKRLIPYISDEILNDLGIRACRDCKDDDDIYTSALDDGMSIRLYNLLLRHGIHKYSEFSKFSADDVRNWKGIGSTLFDELTEILSRKGTPLKEMELNYSLVWKDFLKTHRRQGLQMPNHFPMMMDFIQSHINYENDYDYKIFRLIYSGKKRSDYETYCTREYGITRAAIQKIVKMTFDSLYLQEDLLYINWHKLWRDISDGIMPESFPHDFITLFSDVYPEGDAGYIIAYLIYYNDGQLINKNGVLRKSYLSGSHINTFKRYLRQIVKEYYNHHTISPQLKSGMYNELVRLQKNASLLENEYHVWDINYWELYIYLTHYYNPCSLYPSLNNMNISYFKIWISNMIDSGELGWADTTGEVLSAVFSTSKQKISKSNIAKNLGLGSVYHVDRIVDKVCKDIIRYAILWVRKDVDFFRDRRSAMERNDYDEIEWLISRGYGDIYNNIALFAGIDGMSTKLYKVLELHSILDYRKFARYTEGELMSLYGMGPALSHELIAILKRKGIKFKGE